MRKGILPGNSKSLWKAVKIAKNVSPTSIPINMKINNTVIPSHNVADSFAIFFEKKVAKIVGETVVNQNVYNGRRKLMADSSMFMTSLKITECVKDLKFKNTEGYDRIPQRILIDGLDIVRLFCNYLL